MREDWFERTLRDEPPETEEPPLVLPPSTPRERFTFGIPAPWATEFDLEVATALASQNLRAWITDDRSHKPSVQIVEPLARKADELAALDRFRKGVIIPIDLLPRAYIREGLGTHLAAPDLAWVGQGQNCVAEAMPIEIKQTRSQQPKDASSLLEYQVSGFKLRTLMERNPLLRRTLDAAVATLRCENVIFRDGVLITDEQKRPDQEFSGFLRETGTVRRARILELSEKGAEVVSVRQKERGYAYRSRHDPNSGIHLFRYSHDLFTEERRQFFNQPCERRIIPPATVSIIHGFDARGKPIVSLKYTPKNGIIEYDDLRLKKEYEQLATLNGFFATEKMMHEISRTLREQLLATNTRLEKLRRQLGDLKDGYRSWQITYASRRRDLEERLALKLGPNTLVHIKAKKAPTLNKRFLHAQREAVERLHRRFGKTTVPAAETIADLVRELEKSGFAAAPNNDQWLREVGSYVRTQYSDNPRKKLVNEVSRLRFAKECRRHLQRMVADARRIAEGWALANSGGASAVRAFGYEQLAASALLPNVQEAPFTLGYSVSTVEGLARFAQTVTANMDSHRARIREVTRTRGANGAYDRLPGWLKSYAACCMEFIGEPPPKGTPTPRFYLADERNGRLVTERLAAEAKTLHHACNTYLNAVRKLEHEDKEQERRQTELSALYKATKAEAEHDQARFEEVARMEEAALRYRPIATTRLQEAFPNERMIESIRKTLVKEITHIIDRREKRIRKRTRRFMTPFEKIRHEFEFTAMNDKVRVYFLDIGPEMYKPVIYKVLLVPTIRITS